MRKSKLKKQIEEYLKQLNNANSLISDLRTRIDELETEIEILNTNKVAEDNRFRKVLDDLLNTVPAPFSEDTQSNEPVSEDAYTERDIPAEETAEESPEEPDDTVEYVEITLPEDPDAITDIADITDDMVEYFDDYDILDYDPVANEPKPDSEVQREAIPEAKAGNAIDYGAEIIGKIILKATSACNVIKESGVENQKELITLIFGKTEIIKSEILDIVSQGELDEGIRAQLNDKLNEAEDYYNGILNQ